MSKIDMGWGNPYFLLDVMKKEVGDVDILVPTLDASYPPDLGIPTLIQQTHEIIKLTANQSYKHVVITAGATQAINSVMRYERKRGKKLVYMNEYGYPFYDDMVANSGLERRTFKKYTKKSKNFAVIDSPTNPEGDQITTMFLPNIYWDAVYQSEIYNADMTKYPEHVAMIGSYSKLLGISGARIGWIATNDTALFTDLADVCLKDTATISLMSQCYVSSILDNLLKEDYISDVKIKRFMRLGKLYLDDNRESLNKISKIFDYQDVPECGMFYCVKADKKAVQLLTRAGINFTRLDAETIRLNIGQTKKVVRQAVDAVLKEDKI